MKPGEVREMISKAEEIVSKAEEVLRPLGIAYLETAHELVEASEGLHRALGLLDKTALRGN